MEKPIELRAEDFKNDFIKLLNEANLPLFILNSMLKEITNEVNKSYMEQINAQRKEFEESNK